MVTLSDEDRTALMQAAHRADLAGCSCQSVWLAAEGVVARHVKAALNEAANEIDQAADATQDFVKEKGYLHAARIVRTAADTT